LRKQNRCDRKFGTNAIAMTYNVIRQLSTIEIGNEKISAITYRFIPHCTPLLIFLVERISMSRRSRSI